MRLGGQVFTETNGPEEFVRLHREAGFTACVCPWHLRPGGSENREWKEALAQADLLLAEVGAWCNPLSPDPEEAKAAYARLVERLALAEELGAVTCVNIIGSRHPEHWHGPHAGNFTEDFFFEAVEVYRRALDEVGPKTTRLSFEMMPHNFLDTAERYREFLNVLNRERAGVHLDFANTVRTPREFYNNVVHFGNAVTLLGSDVVTVHLKDLALEEDSPVVRFREVPVGEGGLDYVHLLKLLDSLPPDLPCLLEHLPDAQSYAKASRALRRLAEEAGVQVR
ncbi:MAG TPA: TIM barrel protein [Candidatus Limnocylindria bacterium]|nr:TIM barrel protein [Candidatus Limnocylindria bacterium]